MITFYQYSNIAVAGWKTAGRRLHFVEVVVQRWRAGFQSLPFLDLLNNLVGLGAIRKGAAWKNLPVVKHALWEGLTPGVGPQVSCEAEGLVDRKVGLDHEHGGAGSLCLLEDVSSSPVQHSVDSTDCVLRALDFHKVDWLHQPGLGSEHGGVEHSSGSGDDLTSTSVDGIRMQGHVVDVESDGSQVFVTQHTLLGGPLEPGYNTVLDLVEVLHSLGAVNHQVGSIGVRSEAPDLPGLRDVVVVLIGQVPAPGLEVVSRVHFPIFYVLREAVGHWAGSHE